VNYWHPCWWAPLCKGERATHSSRMVCLSFNPRGSDWDRLTGKVYLLYAGVCSWDWTQGYMLSGFRSRLVPSGNAWFA
jgi:hypothetical protein